MLATLPRGDSERLIGAMAMIERLLDAPSVSARPAILRGPRPGDMGWVVQSHGSLYASEFGFDSSFEGLVAEVAAKIPQLIRRLAGTLLDRRDRWCPGRLDFSRQAYRRSR